MTGSSPNEDTRPGPTGDLSLADEAAIRRTLADYCWSLDQRDWELMKSVFTPDAVWSSPLEQGKRVGATSIVAGLRESRARFVRTQHLIGNVRIVPISKDAAEVTSYILGHDVRAGEPDELVRIAAFEHDLVTKHGDAWLIAERRIEVVWRDAA